MTPKEQARFVRELSKNIAKTIISAIEQKIIPEDWDGHELRVLLSDFHSDSALMSLLYRYPRSRRYRAYVNWTRVTPTWCSPNTRRGKRR